MIMCLCGLCCDVIWRGEGEGDGKVCFVRYVFFCGVWGMVQCVGKLVCIVLYLWLFLKNWYVESFGFGNMLDMCVGFIVDMQ